MRGAPEMRRQDDVIVAQQGVAPGLLRRSDDIERGTTQ